MVNIESTLDERGKTHGDFKIHARIAQGIKNVMRAEPGWGDLSAPQKEALDMTAHKIGRIIAGNANFEDHWVDIAGYTTLVAKEITK
jgi:hypothetical protein